MNGTRTMLVLFFSVIISFSKAQTI